MHALQTEELLYELSYTEFPVTFMFFNVLLQTV